MHFNSSGCPSSHTTDRLEVSSLMAYTTCQGVFVCWGRGAGGAGGRGTGGAGGREAGGQGAGGRGQGAGGQGAGKQGGQRGPGGIGLVLLVGFSPNSRSPFNDQNCMHFSIFPHPISDF